MSIEFARTGDVLKIIVDQETPGKDLEQAANSILDETGLTLVSLDLKNCFYIQSKALASLIAFKKKNAIKVGAEFVISNVCENIMQVLEMSNLTMFFLRLMRTSAHTNRKNLLKSSLKQTMQTEFLTS